MALMGVLAPLTAQLVLPGRDNYHRQNGRDRPPLSAFRSATIPRVFLARFYGAPRNAGFLCLVLNVFRWSRPSLRMSRRKSSASVPAEMPPLAWASAACSAASAVVSTGDVPVTADATMSLVIINEVLFRAEQAFAERCQIVLNR